MSGPEFIKDISGVKPSVVTQLPGDYFHGLGKGGEEKLLTSGVLDTQVAQVPADLELNGATTCPSKNFCLHFFLNLINLIFLITQLIFFKLN